MNKNLFATFHTKIKKQKVIPARFPVDQSPPCIHICRHPEMTAVELAETVLSEDFSDGMGSLTRRHVWPRRAQFD